MEKKLETVRLVQIEVNKEVVEKEIDTLKAVVNQQTHKIKDLEVTNKKSDQIANKLNKELSDLRIRRKKRLLKG